MMHPCNDEEESQLLPEGGNKKEPSVATINPKTNRFATAAQRRRREKYDAAQSIIQQQQQQQQQQLQQEKSPGRTHRRIKAKRMVQKGLRTARDMIQKVNIGRWIDDLEHDQQVADDLDRLNEENKEEEERKQLVAHVHMLCMNAIQEHLSSFLQEHPNGTYEEWIAELHPDNVIPADATSIASTSTANTTTKQNDSDVSTTGGTNSSYTTENHNNNHDPRNDMAADQETTSMPLLRIDPRFYVADSDHLLLWRNSHCKT
jgi:uncharacterized protein YutE (UPF0331/DUF86 family)